MAQLTPTNNRTFYREFFLQRAQRGIQRIVRRNYCRRPFQYRFTVSLDPPQIICSAAR